MSPIHSDSSAVKERLMSLYGSASPQAFTQLLVDYDAPSQSIDTESKRVHDLRAAGRVQILLADGFKPAAAIRFLQEAIRHIETYGLPPSESPLLYPDQNEAWRRLDNSLPLDTQHARTEPRPAAALQNPPAAAPKSPALPVLPPPRAASYPPQAMEPARASLMGRLPALLSTLYNSQRLTALNLSLVPGGEKGKAA